MVINNDEGITCNLFSHCQPFKALLAARSGGVPIVPVLGWGYRVHVWSKSGPKRFFPKLFLRDLGCLNKWFKAILPHFGPILAHTISQKALKWAILGLTLQYRGARWEWEAGGQGVVLKRGYKNVKNSFPKMAPNHMGCSNRWFLAIFSYLAAISPFVEPILLVNLMFPPHQLGPNIRS